MVLDALARIIRQEKIKVVQIRKEEVNQCCKKHNAAGMSLKQCVHALWLCALWWIAGLYGSSISSF